MAEGEVKPKANDAFATLRKSITNLLNAMDVATHVQERAEANRQTDVDSFVNEREQAIRRGARTTAKTFRL